MNDSIETDGADSPIAFPVSAVQTSAQPAAEVLHQEPSKGGSYTRNLETGELVNNDPAVSTAEQE